LVFRQHNEMVVRPPSRVGTTDRIGDILAIGPWTLAVWHQQFPFGRMLRSLTGVKDMPRTPREAAACVRFSGALHGMRWCLASSSLGRTMGAGTHHRCRHVAYDLIVLASAVCAWHCGSIVRQAREYTRRPCSDDPVSQYRSSALSHTPPRV